MIPLASLKMESSGRVVLQVQSTTAVWSTNRTATAQNPVLQLLDAGNVVKLKPSYGRCSPRDQMGTLIAIASGLSMFDRVQYEMDRKMELIGLL
ncbi:hypothetical protein V6N11_042475 [Hibiscus sabdariffa]|uniref:Bulb-type lectin domain-containing protein n=1 Tax=Hibiscus sabdariffa TaxID=183260 RepID=A0ABR2QWF3_9ROSI